MSEAFLTQIARNVLAGFLLMLEIVPSEGDDTLVQDFGYHRVYTLSAKVPPSMEAINPALLFALLRLYISNHNALATAVQFHPYNTELYECPCGCGTFLYVSIYHNA